MSKCESTIPNGNNCQYKLHHTLDTCCGVVYSKMNAIEKIKKKMEMMMQRKLIDMSKVNNKSKTSLVHTTAATKRPKQPTPESTRFIGIRDALLDMATTLYLANAEL